MSTSLLVTFHSLDFGAWFVRVPQIERLYRGKGTRFDSFLLGAQSQKCRDDALCISVKVMSDVAMDLNDYPLHILHGPTGAAHSFSVDPNELVLAVLKPTAVLVA